MLASSYSLVVSTGAEAFDVDMLLCEMCCVIELLQYNFDWRPIVAP